MRGGARAGVLMLRLGVGGLLCWAGISKIAAPAEFAEAISNYRILPAQGNQILAVLLPWWELGAGVLLVSGFWVRPAALLAGGLFGVFATAMMSALWRGLNLSCGCLGAGQGGVVDWTLVIADVGLFGAAIVVARRESVPKSPPSEAVGRS